MSASRSRRETYSGWPRRVAIATNNLFVGGAQQLILTHGKALAARGIDVTVVDLVGGPDRLAGKPEPMREAIRAAGLPIEDFHIRSSRDYAEWRRAWRWFRDWRPDIVHGHLPPADRWSALLGKAVGARTLYTKHDTYRGAERRALRAERLAAGLVFDRVVAISEVTREHLLQNVGVPAGKLVTIANPVDTRRFDPSKVSGRAMRAKLGLSDGAFVVGYVGRLVARKGLRLWLAAAAEAHRHDATMRFVLVGDGSDRASLEAEAARLGLNGALHFAGRQEDVPAWLASFDALLFTPLAGEGLPIALLEALSMGLPVVASNLGANRELLGEAGLLPEPSEWRFDLEDGALDPGPFAEALLRLASDPVLRRRLGNSGRALVERKYALDVVIERQLELYAAMLRA